MRGLKNLFRWGKKYVFILLVIIGLSTVLQVTYSFLPLFVQYAFKVLGNEETNVNLPAFVINFLNGRKDTLTIILWTGLSMVILQGGRSILRFTSNYTAGRLTENIARDMREKMYDHITDLSYTYHNHVDTGDLIQRVTSDIDTSASFLASQFPNLLDIIVTIVIGAVQVYMINSTLMWVSLIIVPVTGISSSLYFTYMHKAYTRIEEAESAMTTVIQENVNSSRVVRAFSTEKYEFDKLDKANKKYSEMNMKFNKVVGLYWGLSDFTVMLQYALTLSTAIILGSRGIVDMADITACLLLMGMLVWPMRGFGRIVSNFGKTMVAVNRIDDVLLEPSEFEINGELKPNITGNIRFDHVSFKFDDDDKNLLSDVSFDVKAGEMVAIVGKTGSGKSTICNLLTRMMEYQEGEIYLDGVSLKDIEKRYLREQVKMVLQDPFLYSKTVYENISITNPGYDRDKVIRAAKLAAVHDEIEHFENGYKTIVGEKGATLSGGQKQRVAIARMLVEECPIIIFDDSLSALDTKTDLMIRQALQSKEKRQTMIIITHRTTTAKEADKIVVLNNGKVEAIGKHEELANQEGLYKELWGIQGLLEEEFDSVMKGEC